jgi:hypothetical protein
MYVYLVLHVKGIRDEVAGITDKSAASARLDEEAFKKGRYVPLGIWSLSLLLFFIFTNTSAAGWYLWAAGEGSLGFYIVSELLLICIAIFALWTVQTRFAWGEPPDIIPSISSFVQPRAAEAPRGKAPKTCPVCNVPATVERRMCRSCGKERDMYWCSKSEHYLIQCPKCRRYTSFGREDCGHCGKAIPDTFACACGARHPPRKWPRAPAD